MTGHRKFNDIRRDVPPTPELEAKMAQLRDAMDDALALGRVRESRQLTQRDVAERLSVSQANVSRIEHEDDVYLSTLRDYVRALGGELRLEAVFSDAVIALVPSTDARNSTDVETISYAHLSHRAAGPAGQSPT